MIEYIEGYAKKNLEKWVGKKWYHQRFDGSPYLMHLVCEGELRTEKEKKQGGEFTVHYCFFGKGRGDWYILIDDIERISKRIMELGRKNPNISSDLISLWKKDQEKFYKKCEEIGELDLSKFSDSDLIKLQDEFLDISASKNSSSSIIDGFALGTDELIASKVKEVYDKSSIKDEMKFTEVFSILTAPIHLSFINDAEVDLLEIALNGDEGDLEEHQKKFFWIKNNYVDSYVLDVDYFREEIDKVVQMKIDIRKEIGKIKNTPMLNKRRKKKLIGKLDIDKDLALLIKISEDFTWWQDERKKSTFWNAHYFYLILEEVSKRVKIPFELMKYMSPREVSDVFDTKLSLSELKSREKGCVFYWDKEGHEGLSGKDAENIKNKILGKTDLSDVDDFRGLTASMGKVVGKVKILKSAKEIGKVEQGDILVAVMTRPDYIPAMKKAAAIVTDEGGVTSHAAIVSRELGIPCIIGTKIATSVLKEGMMVEVNANHGWVKIIK